MLKLSSCKTVMTSLAVQGVKYMLTSRIAITSLAVKGSKHMLASSDVKVRYCYLTACPQRLCLLAVACFRVSGAYSLGLLPNKLAAMSWCVWCCLHAQATSSLFPCRSNLYPWRQLCHPQPLPSWCSNISCLYTYVGIHKFVQFLKQHSALLPADGDGWR